MSTAVASIQHAPRLRHLAEVRVSGTLTEDAQLGRGTGGNQAHAWLLLHFEPSRGLPYVARIDLGADLADHMAAEAQLGLLRRGALVSVAGDALQLRTDHGHAALVVVAGRNVVVVPADAPLPPPATHGADRAATASC